MQQGWVGIFSEVATPDIAVTVPLVAVDRSVADDVDVVGGYQKLITRAAASGLMATRLLSEPCHAR